MTTKLAAEFLGTFWLVLRGCGSAALVAEIVMTSMFLLVIHGTTHRRAPVGFAGLAIGLCLTLIHLIGYPSHQHLGEPGTQQPDLRSSSAPGRSSSCGSSGLRGIAGALLADVVFRALFEPDVQEPPVTGR